GAAGLTAQLDLHRRVAELRHDVFRQPVLMGLFERIAVDVEVVQPCPDIRRGILGGEQQLSNLAVACGTQHGSGPGVKGRPYQPGEGSDRRCRRAPWPLRHQTGGETFAKKVSAGQLRQPTDGFRTSFGTPALAANKMFPRSIGAYPSPPAA